MPIALLRFLQGSVIGLLLSWIADLVGFDMSGVQVLGGSVGFGIGLSLQAAVSDYVSGFVLLWDRSIRVGDVIGVSGEHGVGGQGFGWLEEFSARQAVIRDRDGVRVLLPFHRLITLPVVHWSYSDKRVRVKIPVRLAYESNPDDALRIMMDVARDHRRVLSDPTPVTYLNEFGPSGFHLEIRAWISDPENGVNNVIAEINSEVRRRFMQLGLEIPIRRTDVTLTHDDIDT